MRIVRFVSPPLFSPAPSRLLLFRTRLSSLSRHAGSAIRSSELLVFRLDSFSVSVILQQSEDGRFEGWQVAPGGVPYALEINIEVIMDEFVPHACDI